MTELISVNKSAQSEQMKSQSFNRLKEQKNECQTLPITFSQNVLTLTRFSCLLHTVAPYINMHTQKKNTSPLFLLFKKYTITRSQHNTINYTIAI